MQKKFLVFLVLFAFVFTLIFNLQSSSASPGLAFRKVKNVKIHPKQFLPGESAVKGRPNDGPPGLDKPDDGDSAVVRYTTGSLGSPLANNANKYAIVVGICDYADTYEGDPYYYAKDICLSDGDAKNMNEALVNIYGYDEKNIILLRDSDATSTGIVNAINKISGLEKAGDEVVFFYSGHGVTGEIQGSGEDVDEGIFVHDRLVIWDDDLRDLFFEFDTDRIIFIFDTCKAGGMDDLDIAGSNRVLAMATDETGNAGVYSTGENGEGLFSHWFVKSGILDGRADFVDHDNDRKAKDVTIEEAFDYASKKTRTRNPQMIDNFANDLWLGY
ncbi:caspase family protein [Candidatus Parcubacteria bacterium]|nr:caspase family protein [Candidatus Parcubacteria bacterium]